MSQKKRKKESSEVRELQSRIDQGILLAQQRLIARAKHDDLSLIIRVDGQVREVPAKEL